MSAFNDAIANALGTVNDVAGETVTYVRGDESIEDLIAVPGLDRRRTDGIENVPVSAGEMDWIFEAAELVINDDPILPQRGDQVHHTVGGETTVYVVQNDGDQVYRWSDRARTRLRVHTIESGAAE